MLFNYFKIAWRSLLKNKLFSLINIVGMSISMASVILIGIYVEDELKFDKHVPNADLKFRVYNEVFNENGTRKAANIPPAIAPALKENFPEVISYARYQHIHSPLLFVQGDKRFVETRGGFADPQIFGMLGINVIEGDVGTALIEPSSVAISETVAAKYFANASAIGKGLIINEDNYKVTAVFADVSKHAHLQLDYMLSMSTLQADAPELMKSWGWMQFHTYLEIDPAGNVEQLEGKIQKLIESTAWPITKPDGSYYVPHLMNIRDIHLHASDHLWDSAVKGNIQTIRIMSGVAGFILVIAALNFINLSTARAVNRVKEVGMRKTVGAAKTQLVLQFLSESVVIALVSFFLAGLMIELSIPFLNAFTEKEIPLTLFFHPLRFALLVVIAVIIGIVSGLYPAFYLTKLRPSAMLSAKSNAGNQRSVLRTSLVVVQFILSFAMIIAAFVARDQNEFLRSKDIGFEKENVVVLQLRGDMRGKVEAVKELIKNHPNVKSASSQYGLPGEIYSGDIFIDGITQQPVHTSQLLVDEDFVETLGLELRAGRGLSRDFPSDRSEGFMITETTARLFGFTQPDLAIGHPLSWHPWDSDSLKKGKVVGVLKDFHLNSLKENIVPVVLHTYPQFHRTLSIRITPNNIEETIAHLQSVWNSLNTGWPFEYRFLDSNFDRMYKAEDRLSTLFTCFTVFTIIVACLGLFGLVVYSTTQRFKEIAIRKVLGANTMNLILRLSSSYMLMMFIAFAIAIPLSLYVTQGWLDNFAYHIELSWTLFLKAAFLITIIAVTTVSLQALKAAQQNPSDALKEQ